MTLIVMCIQALTASLTASAFRRIVPPTVKFRTSLVDRLGLLTFIPTPNIFACAAIVHSLYEVSVLHDLRADAALGTSTQDREPGTIAATGSRYASAAALTLHSSFGKGSALTVAPDRF